MDNRGSGTCKVCGKNRRLSSEAGRPKIIDAVVDKNDGIARISQPKYKIGFIEHLRGSRIAGIASTLDGFLILTLVIMAAFLMFQPFSMDWRSGISLMQNKGIEISALRTDQLTRNGKPALRVEGRITNNDSVRREIGDVTIVVKKPAGKAFRSWKHKPAMEYLEPGQSIRFISAASSLPGRASRIEVSAAGYVTGVNM